MARPKTLCCLRVSSDHLSPTESTPSFPTQNPTSQIHTHTNTHRYIHTPCLGPSINAQEGHSEADQTHTLNSPGPMDQRKDGTKAQIHNQYRLTFFLFSSTSLSLSRALSLCASVLSFPASSCDCVVMSNAAAIFAPPSHLHCASPFLLSCLCVSLSSMCNGFCGAVQCC